MLLKLEGRSCTKPEALAHPFWQNQAASFVDFDVHSIDYGIYHFQW
jgi:hypothetical protein